MISLRMFPGSPNALYNLLFPHLKTISLGQNLIGVAIGQLPYNVCVAKAGQIIRRIHNRADIIDLTTSLELVVVAVMFMLPLVFSQCSRKKAPAGGRSTRRLYEDISTSASTSAQDCSMSYSFSEEDEEECLLIGSSKQTIELYSRSAC